MALPSSSAYFLRRHWFQRAVAAILLGCMVLLLPPQANAQSGDNRQNPIVYVVNWGDSLNSIALEYGTTTETIVAANRLEDADLIAVGQRLMIPAAAPATLTAAPPDVSGTHTVTAGENLYRVSLLYGVTTTQLMAVNSLLSTDQIYAGQELAIPNASNLLADAPATPTTEPTPEPTSQNQAVTHIVQPGELLGNIASRYDVSTTALVQANNVTNPSLLYVGQVLTIPGPEESLQPQAVVTEPDSSGSTIYVVQRGDTLFRIALNNAVTVDALMQANHLTDASNLLVGQVLQISTADVIDVAAVQPAAVAEELQGSNPEAEVAVTETTAETAVTLTPELLLPTPEAPPPTTMLDKEILIDLSQQALYAYKNGNLLRSFVISSGLPATPTVLGTYDTYLRYDSQRMYGPGYDLPGVPWVQYFYLGYAIHGTYWHNNFGQPMSHGCINMRPGEAKWLYDWAPMGITVTVQQ